MVRKLIASVVLLSLTGASAYAMEISKGKLLSHKEWTTGNVIKSSFLEVNKKQNTLLSSIWSKNTLGSKVIPMDIDVLFTGARIFAGQMLPGVVGEEVTLFGFTRHAIDNRSASMQTYQLYSTLCAQTGMGTGTCATSEDDVSIEPGGYIAIERRPNMTVSYDEPGTYNVAVFSAIYRDGAPFHYTSDDADISIYATPSNAK